MRRYLIAGLIVLMGVGGETAAPQRPSTLPQRPSTSPPRLFKDSHETLAVARAQGRRDVSLIVAAVPGGAAAVAQQAMALGGDVRYREDEVGYLRVKMPIDRAVAFSELDGIESVSVDYDSSYPARMMRPGASDAPTMDANLPLAQQQTEAWPPAAWSAYPLEHPYSPVGDLGAAEFLKQHPTYDGRGVTIALLDGNIDLLLPEFQTAYALDGTQIPKVADFLNVTDPRDDGALNPQWVDMHEVVTSQGGKVTFGGKTFTTPRDGTFRIGIFSERKFNWADYDIWGQDIDRNGNPRGDDGQFGVLWDEQTNDVWVDTNRDLSFADQKPMTDYIKRQDVGVFGKDDPATPLRESVGFTVQTDPKNKLVSINVGMFGHATIIMGSVIANREPKGRLQGVAPGARIASMYYGVSNAHGLIEGLIAAFKHPLVDLVVLEQSVLIASLPYLLADGHHPISIIAQRLTDRYHKLLFVPGDNAPAFAFVAEDGLAPGAMSVGGYQSQESYRVNDGFIPEAVDNMHWGALSHGPSGSGALKPDLLAPSGQMGTYPGYRKGDKFDYVREGLWQLPPGYTVDGGTSTATPMAAGATALVVSAAKQTHVPYDALRLKAALTGSTRYIPRLAAHEQGNGLIQVGAAYDLLTKLEHAPAISVTSRAPVRTRLSPFLQTPNQGVGIYEREGWSAGDRGTRTVTFTRTSGPAEPMTCAVSWQGNDGTFTSAASVVLPLNKPVDLSIAIAVKDAGPHTAILTLDHPSVPGHVHRVLNTVVAALHFTSANAFTAKADVHLPRPGDRSVFVDVPAGVGALTMSGTSEAPGDVQLVPISPSREMMWGVTAIAHPEPGVWEINVSMNGMARKFDPDLERPLKPAQVSVTAKLVGVTLSADGAHPASPPSASLAAGGGAIDIPLTVMNAFSALSVAAVPAALGSAFQAKREIARGEQQLYSVDVPKGATSLRARVSDVTDAAADLDLYLMECTPPPEEKPAPEKDKGNMAAHAPPPTCAMRAKASTIDRDGEVEVANPKPGRWVIVVDAYNVPSGRTGYAYVDVFTHPRFGTLAVTDSVDAHDPRAAWTTKAHAWVSTLPDAPRVLQVRIAAVSPEIKGRAGSPVALGTLDIMLGAPIQTATAGSGSRGGSGHGR